MSNSTTQQLWAIKVPFSGPDDWLFVTKHNPQGDIGKGTDIEIQTFTTHEEALKTATAFKKFEIVPIYKSN